MAQFPFIQGHRGCRGIYPENSLPAFRHALNIGVQVLEMDVCLSSDGAVVVSHEPYMNSLYASHPSGNPVLKSEEESLNLYRMMYSEITKYDVGKRGNRLFPEQRAVAAVKPLLRDVLSNKVLWKSTSLSQSSSLALLGKTLLSVSSSTNDANSLIFF